MARKKNSGMAGKENGEVSGKEKSEVSRKENVRLLRLNLSHFHETGIRHHPLSIANWKVDQMGCFK